MSIQSQIDRINSAKSGIAGAITEKGVTVPETASIDDYAELIKSISGSSVIDNGQCGENVYWSLYDNGVLKIYGEGSMYDTYELLHDDNRIINVIIEDGVTSISTTMFLRCKSMLSIHIPESVVKIGSSAFMHCTNLREIRVPSGVTDILAAVFMGCTNMHRIFIPNSVVSIFHMAFYIENSTLDIFYEGTKSQWDNVSIVDSNNDAILNGVLHCEYEESTNADTVDGWHFAVRDDGTPPPSGVTNTMTLVYTAGG